MAYGTPADPVAGTVITVAYAVANLLTPIRWLRQLTGNADPPGSSYVVVSSSTTGTTWAKVPSDALAAGVAVANLGYTPVNRAGDSISGHIVLNNSIALETKDLGGTTRTLIFMDSGDNVLVGATAGTSALYLFAKTDNDAFVAVPGHTRTLWHSGNAGIGPFLPLAGGSLSGEVITADGVGITFGGASTPGRIYDVSGTTTVVRSHNNRLGIYNYALTQEMLDIQASAVTVLGQIIAASAAIAGAISGASATLSGALSAASAAITGAITAATMTATGLVKGSTLESTVATGTPPMAVASTTQVNNLKAAAAALADNASLLGGLAASSFARLDFGVWTGSAGVTTITCGFRPRIVFLIGNGTTGFAFPTGNTTGFLWSSVGVGNTAQVTLTATGFTLSAGGVFNTSPNSYSYVALGN